MERLRSLILAGRMARREFRAGLGGFKAFLFCLALGVAAISCVGLIASSVESSLNQDARAILGGDISIRRMHRPLEAGELTELKKLGAVSHVITMRAMAMGENDDSVLCQLKAVDDAYPLFGAIELEGGGDPGFMLSQKARVPNALAGSDLTRRLNIRPGEVFYLAGKPFRLTGFIKNEPDRVEGFFSLGPRVMVSEKALTNAGLINPFSLARHEYRIRLKNPGQVTEITRRIKVMLEPLGWRVRNHLDSGTRMGRQIRNVSRRLILISLTTLLIGGLGVSQAVRSYLERRIKVIAAMKCLGATRGMIFSIFLFQTMGLALAGSLLGLFAGFVAAQALASLLGPSLSLELGSVFSWQPLLTALVFGILIALAFSLRPLSAAGRVSAARLFRGYAEGGMPRPGLISLAAVGGCFGLILLMALTLMGESRITWWFAASVVICALAFQLLAYLVKTLARLLPRPKDPRLHHALANLHRPGSTTAGVVLTMGLGFTMLAAGALVDSNLSGILESRLPKKAPSYYFMNIPSAEINSFKAMLESGNGARRFSSQPFFMGRITRVNGRPSSEIKAPPNVRWILRGDRGLTFAGKMPKGAKLKQGKWWAGDYRGAPLISLDAQIAEGLGLKTGDTMTFNIMGRPVTARIANLRDIDWLSLNLNQAVIFSPGLVDKAPHTFLASLHAPEETQADILKKVVKRYPSVVAIDPGPILSQAASILGKLRLVHNLASMVTLAACLLVLAQTFRTSLRNRRYQSVVFKVFGATRRDLSLTLLSEFAMQGLCAVGMACLLGWGIAFWFMDRILGVGFTFEPGPMIMVLAGGVSLTVILGLASVRGSLSQKAWPMLRNE